MVHFLREGSIWSQRRETAIGVGRRKADPEGHVIEQGLFLKACRRERDGGFLPGEFGEDVVCDVAAGRSA